MRTSTIRSQIGRAVRGVLAALFLTALAANAADIFQFYRIDLSRDRVSTAGHRIRMVTGQVSPSNHTVRNGTNRTTDHTVRHGFAKTPDVMYRRSW